MTDYAGRRPRVQPAGLTPPRGARAPPRTVRGGAFSRTDGTPRAVPGEHATRDYAPMTFQYSEWDDARHGAGAHHLRHPLRPLPAAPHAHRRRRRRGAPLAHGRRQAVRPLGRGHGPRRLYRGAQEPRLHRARRADRRGPDHGQDDARPPRALARGDLRQPLARPAAAATRRPSPGRATSASPRRAPTPSATRSRTSTSPRTLSNAFRRGSASSRSSRTTSRSSRRTTTRPSRRS